MTNARQRLSCRVVALLVAAVAVASGAAMAAPEPPTELGATVRLDEQPVVFWESEADARIYNLYKGRIPAGSAWIYDHVCLVIGARETTFLDPVRPAVGELFYYLVAKESQHGEGPLGDDSFGIPRPSAEPCVDVDADGVADNIDNCLTWPMRPNSTPTWMAWATRVTKTTTTTA